VIDKNSIDPNALHYYRQLKEAGFSAYFVGGSVRDLLLGKQPKDFDIATNATPQQIKRVIPHGRIIGRRFRHVMLERNGGRYEIVTFRGPIPVEAMEDLASGDDGSTEGPEGAGGPDGNERADSPEHQDAPPHERREKRYPDLNQFGTAEQDALRRDFTINALFYDPDLDELVDYVEGKLDVDRRIVRTIGDAAVRMQEDPIRILRAIRHKIKLGLEYDGSLERAMREKAPLLQETSKDRIREEFLKVCNDHSLGAFLQEANRMGLTPHLMPWFENASEEEWKGGVALWNSLADMPTPERPRPEFGLALMMIPLIPRLVMEPYRQGLREGDSHHLPDMKYFLSCESLRDYYLRNLRISRAQTDALVRTLFYFSRMTGLWIEQGPPRRVIGRLFQHPPAILAAQLSKFALTMEQKPIPDWLEELAQYDQQTRRRHAPREREQELSHRGPRPGRIDGPRDLSIDSASSGNVAAEESVNEPQQAAYEPREIPQKKKLNRLLPPDAPMIWNGPLHAPVLRPIFAEEVPNRWARKNQGVQAFRPSGIPNQPLALKEEKMRLVHNYKPELTETSAPENQRQQEENPRDRNQRGRGRGRDRDRERGRGRGRGPRRDGEAAPAQGFSQQEPMPPETFDAGSRPVNPTGEAERLSRPVPPPPPSRWDPDSLGNIRAPGEAPAPLAGINPPMEENYDDGFDDDIGNRLDRPPTSGHIGVNGEGVVGQRGQRPQRNTSQGARNNSGRRRGRGRRGGGGGGPPRSGGPRGPQNPMS
jgi:poly(A) polymerase